MDVLGARALQPLSLSGEKPASCWTWGYIGEMEKKMETRAIHRDKGKENGN